MSGGSISGGKRKRARIEIIPLIDVIFFLLATFVLFTLSLTKSNGQPVRQPDSATGEPRDPTGHTITIQPEGNLAWDKDPVSADEFLRRIQEYHLQEPDGRILINGDQTSHFSGVIYVMDQARLAGFRKVFIEVRTTQNKTKQE